MTQSNVRAAFERHFNTHGTLYASAGRINLIGEHTDYNGGFVFPGAVDCGITAMIRPNGTDRVRAYAVDLDSYAEFGLREEDKPAESWARYIFGVCREIQKRGGRIGGFPGDEFPNVAFGRARLVEVVHVVLVEEGHGAVVTGQIRVAESPQEACFAAQMVVFELRELRIADLREDLVREADRPVENGPRVVREGHSARGEARGVGGGVVPPSVAVVGQTFAQHREIAPESHLAAQLIIDRVDDALHLCRIGHEGRGVYLFGMFFEELPFFARRKRRCDTGGGQQCEYDVFHGLRRLGR